MGNARTNSDLISFGGKYPAALIDAFKRVCDESDVSMKKALERCLMDCVRKNRIPGVEILNWKEETRNKEKFKDGGTDRYDGDDNRDPAAPQSGTDRAIL